MSTVWCSTKPVADAAMPVKALSSEMTTGMSAPPMGSTNRTPNARAPRMSATSSASSTPATIAMPRPTSTEQQEVAVLLAGIRDRPAGHQLLELREGDHAAREGHRADERREHDGDRDVEVEVARRRDRVVEVREGDQRRRPAADAVEQRHHLRHRGHLHGARARTPRSAPSRPSRSSPRRTDPSRGRAGRTSPRWRRPCRRRRSSCRASRWLDRRGSAARG